MDEYGYSIITTTNNIYVNFLNYLYSKKDNIKIHIDPDNYNIYIHIKTENDFEEILLKTKEYYPSNYTTKIPYPVVSPVFI